MIVAFVSKAVRGVLSKVQKASLFSVLHEVTKLETNLNTLFEDAYLIPSESEFITRQL